MSIGIMGTVCLFCILVGVIIGQLSVWRGLRKRGSVTIGKWTYRSEKRS